MKKLKVIELFAGIGGFRRGLEDANEEIRRLATYKNGTAEPLSGGHGVQYRRYFTDTTSSGWQQQSKFYNCVYANEWDKYAASVYRWHYGDVDTRDVATVSTFQIPEHDVLTAGFPCQAFSVAGLRRGFEDTRGSMFFEVARVLADKRPRYFLLENVKGLYSNDSGKTFQTILTVLHELGYDIQWDLLNSKNFSVPQNRERVFIVGHLRGQSRPEIFPIRNDLATLEEKSGTYSYAIDANYYKGAGNKAQRTMIHSAYSGVDGTNYREYDKYSPTITTPTGGGHLPMVQEKQIIRRLTPKECERLQGFPDDYTKYGINEEEYELSDTQRYKCLGNAVTTTVVKEIAMRLYENITLKEQVC